MANLAGGWIDGLLSHVLGGLVEARIEATMERSQQRILSGMRAKGVEPPGASVALCSRDALFRLWKAVVRSGDLADVIRDAQDQDVVPVVEAQFGVGVPVSLEAIVTATRGAALARVFGKP